MAERRYSEVEMAEIFRRATEEAASIAARSGDSTDPERGFTLAQLQAIGSEVGVGSAVDLPRPLSRDEFERFTSHLRDTFQAHGEVRDDGRFREWRNGNLLFSLEPHGSGERLRMSTRKSEGEIMPAIGMAITGLGIFFGLVSLLATPEKAPMMPAVTIIRHNRWVSK